MVASVLSAFDISKARDENGAEIDIDPDAFSTGLSRSVIHFPECNAVNFNCDLESLPQPFNCTVVPRSPQAATLVRTAAIAAKENTSVG
jgi:hypothetical protein